MQERDTLGAGLLLDPAVDLRHPRAKAALHAVYEFCALLNYTGAAGRVFTTRQV